MCTAIFAYPTNMRLVLVREKLGPAQPTILPEIVIIMIIAGWQTAHADEERVYARIVSLHPAILHSIWSGCRFREHWFNSNAFAELRIKTSWLSFVRAGCRRASDSMPKPNFNLNSSKTWWRVRQKRNSSSNGVQAPAPPLPHSAASSISL